MRMNPIKALTAAFVALALAACSGPSVTVAPTTAVSADEMPPASYEFRAAWIATVANIDWPSRRDLDTATQQAELRTILDRAVQLNLNAVIFQVRPAADALYDSPLEPWSEYLTGEMGKAPDPYYDPLAFAIDECHRRGLELHAWFNPFRAHHPTGSSPISLDHISNVEPSIVKAYGDYLWLDPGEQLARDHSLAVVLDVVRRYDVDGVHIDDYFYPYAIRDSLGEYVSFPDSTSWERAVAAGDTLSRSDWRRDNIDRFVERMYLRVKEEKPWVKVGISPFGIWRPGHPEQIEGYDAYEMIYADARKWLREGWVDYFTPQLYWSIAKPEQSYPVLLDWWAEQNVKQRHLWPGNFTSRVILDGARYWGPEEVLDQVSETRIRNSATGNVHFSMKALLRDTSTVGLQLAEGPYVQPALVPPSPWLGARTVAQPGLSIDAIRGETYVLIKPGADDQVWLWLVRAAYGRTWRTTVVPGWKQAVVVARNNEQRPDIVVVNAVDRLGNQSSPASITRIPS